MKKLLLLSVLLCILLGCSSAVTSLTFEDLTLSMDYSVTTDNQSILEQFEGIRKLLSSAEVSDPIALAISRQITYGDKSLGYSFVSNHVPGVYLFEGDESNPRFAPTDSELYQMLETIDQELMAHYLVPVTSISFLNQVATEDEALLDLFNQIVSSLPEFQMTAPVESPITHVIQSQAPYKLVLEIRDYRPDEAIYLDMMGNYYGVPLEAPLHAKLVELLDGLLKLQN